MGHAKNMGGGGGPGGGGGGGGGSKPTAPGGGSHGGGAMMQGGASQRCKGGQAKDARGVCAKTEGSPKAAGRPLRAASSSTMLLTISGRSVLMAASSASRY